MTNDEFGLGLVYICCYRIRCWIFGAVGDALKLYQVKASTFWTKFSHSMCIPTVPLHIKDMKCPYCSP